jgi:ribulose-phosphate 3-epimerase
MKNIIAASMLSADQAQLEEEALKVSAADWIHVDVMDNKFVPNTALTVEDVQAMNTKLAYDVHLMVKDPIPFIREFSAVKPRSITVHQEACEDLPAVIEVIKKEKIRVGVAVMPETKIDTIKQHLNDIDMVLVMTVNPGFGGQKFMTEMMPKIKKLRQVYHFTKDIQVDGGITPETIKIAKEQGANVFVAGSYLFRQEDRAQAINNLRDALKDV